MSELATRPICQVRSFTSFPVYPLNPLKESAARTAAEPTANAVTRPSQRCHGASRDGIATEPEEPEAHHDDDQLPGDAHDVPGADRLGLRHQDREADRAGGRPQRR